MVVLLSPQGALGENVRNPMVFLQFPQGAPSEDVMQSYGFPSVLPRRALRENVRKACGFRQFSPGGPQRKREEILWFSCCPSQGGPHEKPTDIPMVFLQCHKGALSENVRK